MYFAVLRSSGGLVAGPFILVLCAFEIFSSITSLSVQCRWPLELFTWGVSRIAIVIAAHSIILLEIYDLNEINWNDSLL